MGHVECHNVHSSAFESPAFSQLLGMESQTGEQKGPPVPYLICSRGRGQPPLQGWVSKLPAEGQSGVLALAKNGFL